MTNGLFQHIIQGKSAPVYSELKIIRYYVWIEPAYQLINSNLNPCFWILFFLFCSELSSKLQDTLELIEEQLDFALSKTCTKFDKIHYEKLQMAYTLLGKRQVYINPLLLGGLFSLTGGTGLFPK